MQLILDRFEEDKAVCEAPDGTTVVLLRSQLPKNTTPGCMLQRQSDGSIQIDWNETTRRREKIAQMQKNLFHKE